MRASLLVGGLIFLVVGLSLGATLLSLILGLPVAAIGIMMILFGVFVGRNRMAEQQNSDERQRRYQRYQAEQYDRHRREIEAQERSMRKQ
jgi:uncharacterized membrane protein